MSNPKIFLQPELIEGDNIDIAQDGKTISSNTPLENITNTDITEVEDGQALIYDETSGKWVNGEGGTPIEPNPAAAATDTLSTIKIDNTVFSIGGGGTGDAVLYPLTTAEYNALTPEQKMDENVLYLLTDGGSGGGGGTGSGYSETVLWENASGQSFVNSPAITLTLNDDISNYDMLMFELAPSNNPRWRYHNIALTQNIDKTGTNYFGSVTVGGTEGYAPGITYIDETSLSFHSWGQAYSLTIYKIIGIKFGGGGSNVIPNPEDETTDVLNSIKIDDTTYAIQGGGSFIDVENRIVALTEFTTSLTYTATEDCVVCMYLVCPGDASTFVKINDFTVQNFWQAELATGPCAPIFVRAGQTLTVTGAHTTYASNYTVYGVQSSGGGGGTGNLNAVEMDYEDWLALPQEEREDPDIEYFLNNAPGGSSSEVIPNPQGTATDTLNTVEIDGTIYELSGEEYEAGENISITNNVISAVDTTYTAGTNIQINAQNEISAHENMIGETVPISSEGNNNAIYMQYSTTGGETSYETIWTGSVSTSAWASPVQIGTINPSEYYRIKITGTGSGEKLVSEIPVVGSGDLWHLGHEMYIFTANDCTELWLYSSTGYSNTVTKVEATTYDEKMVDSIEKVYGKIKDDWYEIATGGDTNIVPNPQGEATDTLNTVSIDGTIFDLPNGGGGGLNVTVTKILDQHIETTGEFALDDSIDSYDALLIGGYNYVSSSYSNQYKTTLILKEDYYKNTSNHADHILGNMTASTSGDNPRRVIFYFPDDTHINIQTRNFASIDKIFGLKFEQGGGGATFEGLDYSNATDLTLPDNTGYTYTPSEDGVIMVTAYGNVGALAIQQDNFEAIHLAHGSDRWTTSWCFVEKGVNYTLRSTSRSNSWPSGSWVKFIPLKQSSSGGGGSSEVNYSTDEQKIGTWIDGKPIYQITLELNVTLDTTNWISVNIDNFVKQIKYIIHFDAMTDDGTNTHDITGTIYELQPYQNNGTQMIDIHCTLASARTLKYLTIQYTKTTD